MRVFWYSAIFLASLLLPPTRCAAAAALAWRVANHIQESVCCTAAAYGIVHVISKHTGKLYVYWWKSPGVMPLGLAEITLRPSRDACYFAFVVVRSHVRAASRKQSSAIVSAGRCS